MTDNIMSNTVENTRLSHRDRFKNSQIAHDKFPPCGEMTYLIDRLRENGFEVHGKILDVGCGQGRFSDHKGTQHSFIQ